MRVLALLITILLAETALAQSREHLFEEQEVFEMNWEEGYSLFVNGEQAEIIIKPHDNQKLKCVFTRYSQHNEELVAKDDLDLMILYKEEKRTSLSLRNYVRTKSNGDNPEAQLRAKFVIYVPKDSSVGLIKIWNYFGKVSITDISSPLELKLEFSNLDMNSVSANTELMMKYGEAQLFACANDFEINLDRANASIEHHRGRLNLNTAYAEVDLFHLTDIEFLEVKAKKSKLFLDIPKFSGPSYDIVTVNTIVKSLVGPQLKRTMDEDKIKFSYAPRDIKGVATIIMETGKLNYTVK